MPFGHVPIITGVNINKCCDNMNIKIDKGKTINGITEIAREYCINCGEDLDETYNVFINYAKR